MAILLKCDNLELLSGIQIFMDCFQEVVRDIEVFCEENCKERKSIIGELKNEWMALEKEEIYGIFFL